MSFLLSCPHMFTLADPFLCGQTDWEAHGNQAKCEILIIPGIGWPFFGTIYVQGLEWSGSLFLQEFVAYIVVMGHGWYPVNDPESVVEEMGWFFVTCLVIMALPPNANCSRSDASLQVWSEMVMEYNKRPFLGWQRLLALEIGSSIVTWMVWTAGIWVER